MIPVNYEDLAMRIPKDLLNRILKDGFIEIVLRDKNKRYLPFVKLALSKIVKDSGVDQLLSVVNPVSQTTGWINSVTGLINVGLNAYGLVKNKQYFERIMKQLASITSIGYLNAALSTTNLVVGAVGFKLINSNISGLRETMDDVASKVDKIDAKLENSIIQEYQEIAMQFSGLAAMVDGYGMIDIKDTMSWLNRAQPFMNKLINNMSKGAMDKGLALEMLFTLLPAFTNVTIMMLREYRFSTGKEFGMTGQYLSLYEQLLDAGFTAEVSDYLFMEQKKHFRDVYTISLGQKAIVEENLNQLKDEMKLLEVIDTRETYKKYSNALYDVIRGEMEERIPEIAEQGRISTEECTRIIDQAIAVSKRL